MLKAVQEGQCAVCRRMENGAGHGHPPLIVWTCHQDISLAQRVYSMRSRIAQIEDEAVKTGGEKAGAFLDTLGRTDLAKLSKEEWLLFLETFLNGYGDAMRAKLHVPGR